MLDTRGPNRTNQIFFTIFFNLKMWQEFRLISQILDTFASHTISTVMYKYVDAKNVHAQIAHTQERIHVV